MFVFPSITYVNKVQRKKSIGNDMSYAAVSGVYPTERSEESRILALGIEVIVPPIHNRPFI